MMSITEVRVRRRSPVSRNAHSRGYELEGQSGGSVWVIAGFWHSGVTNWKANAAGGAKRQQNAR